MSESQIIGFLKLKELMKKARKKFLEDESIKIYRVNGYFKIHKDCLDEDLK